MRLSFEDGILTHLDDQPVVSPLLTKIGRGGVDREMGEELNRETGHFFRPMPLGSWYGYGLDSHYVPLFLSPKVVDPNVMIDGTDLMGINFLAELVVALQRAGLDCDYRYGCVWITTAEDAKDSRIRRGC